jgi:uncharacterized protein with GYD domain
MRIAHVEATGGTTMANYILLVDWTGEGIRAVKESPSRLDKAREMAKGLGVQFEQFYMVMGDHDMVAVLDAPNDDAIARFVLKLSMAGKVRTKTLKAFTEDQYRGILGAL